MGISRSRWLNYWLTHLVVIMGGVSLIGTQKSVLVAIGTSLAATGVAGLVLYLYVKFHHDDIQKQEHLRSFGLEDAFEGRSVSIRKEYESRLHSANSQIDVLGFGLKHLKEDFGDDFRSWAAKANVRILLIDPFGPTKKHSYADQRVLEEKDENKSIVNSVGAFLEATQTLRSDRDSQFQVRLFTCLPSINIFRIDNEMFWGPYLIGEPSRNTPTFLVKRGGFLFERLQQHFDRIWDGFSKEPPSSPDP